jgi:hypothetical protein
MSAAVAALPLWLPDNQASKCPTCSRGFGLTVRRHHCRACGGVFCDTFVPIHTLTHLYSLLD